MDDKIRLIKREIRRCRADVNNIYTISLADLVMMQMVGNFDTFLETIVSGTNKLAIEAAIRATRQNVTTPRLFSGIVNKTIEAQFGNKYATIRELGQNAIDAYGLDDTSKVVKFHVGGDGQYLVLRARDYGCGMTLKSLVKDLLIPYNSGKEFDPTKIGEHGIGWYSIVDVADLVKVTTRSNGHTCQTLIYNDGEWRATIHPMSSNGFSKKFNGHDENGTEVSAYVQSMSKVEIVNHLYQFLGTVDRSYGQVYYNQRHVNSISETYRRGAPVQTVISANVRPLIMSVSKREIQGGYHDVRFKYRNQNLSKILYTQRGLFIKYDDSQFIEETVHHKLITDMMSMGLDFWIDIPEHVMLTKGRNNVVADHMPAVLDSSYKAFENVFLDILLEDDEVLEHSSGILLTSIANIFEQKYQFKVREVQRNKYSLKRRLASIFAAGLSKCIDFVKICLKSVALLFIALFRNAPIALWKLGQIKVTKKGLSVAAFYIGVAVITITIAAVVTALFKSFGWAPFLYALYFLIFEVVGVGSYYGLKWFVKSSLQLAISIQFSINNILRSLAEFGRGFIVLTQTLMRTITWDKMSTPDISDVMLIPVRLIIVVLQLALYIVKYALNSVLKVVLSLRTPLAAVARVLNICKVYTVKWFMTALHFCGLYVNMEAKRERKRLQQCKKVSKKYLTFMHKDTFFKRIAHKKIINATMYYSAAEEAREQSSLSSIFRSTFVETLNDIGGLLSFSEESPPVIPETHHESSFRKQYGLSNKLTKYTTKISIDEAIQYYLQIRLKYVKDDDRNQLPKFSHGDVFVNYSNPLLKSVIDKMEQVAIDIRNQYDVSILEDHLDNVGTALIATLMFLYFMSGLGFCHVILSFIFRTQVHNPFLKVAFYVKTKDFIVRAFNWLFIKKKAHIRLWNTMVRAAKHCARQIPDTLREMRRRGTSVIKSIAVLPFVLVGKIARFTFRWIITPVCRVIDPRRYPTYISVVLNVIVSAIAGFVKGATSESPVQRLSNGFYDLKEKQRKANVERQKESSKLLKVMLKNVGFFEKLYHSWIEWYKVSPLFYFFGDGSYGGKDFKGMTKSKLANIVKLANVGKAYYEYFCMVEAMDYEVCRALACKPYKITYGGDRRFSYVHHHFIADEKELQISTNISSSYVSPIRTSGPYGRRFTASEVSVSTLAYHLLDQLIHLRAHHNIEDMMRINHTIQFYTKKSELRRTVVQYFLDNNIEPGSVIAKCLTPEEETMDAFYYIDDFDFSRLALMTIRRLKHEKLKYDVEREQMRIDEEKRKVEAVKRQKEEEAKRLIEEKVKKKEEEEKLQLQEIIDKINKLPAIL